MAAGISGESARLICDKTTAATVQNDQAERIAELERLVGQLTMENTLLKKGKLSGSTTAEKRAMIDALHLKPTSDSSAHTAPTIIGLFSAMKRRSWLPSNRSWS
jgi:hypothetical protein